MAGNTSAAEAWARARHPVRPPFFDHFAAMAAMAEPMAEHVEHVSVVGTAFPMMSGAVVSVEP